MMRFKAQNAGCHSHCHQSDSSSVTLVYLRSAYIQHKSIHHQWCGSRQTESRSPFPLSAVWLIKCISGYPTQIHPSPMVRFKANRIQPQVIIPSSASCHQSPLKHQLWPLSFQHIWWLTHCRWWGWKQTEPRASTWPAHTKSNIM